MTAQRELAERAFREAAAFHIHEAFQVADGLLSTIDPSTGLITVRIQTVRGELTANGRTATGIGLGRQTASLTMAASLARTLGDTRRVRKYLACAERNFRRGVELLGRGDRFIDRASFDSSCNVIETSRGEPGKGPARDDSMIRVNVQAYAIRGWAELLLATGSSHYGTELERYLERWIEDFHDPLHGSFFLHTSVDNPSLHGACTTLRAPDGGDPGCDAGAGLKGVDGAVHSLSALLLTASRSLTSYSLQALVKEQVDTILNRLLRLHGTLWEVYTRTFEPVIADLQEQPCLSLPSSPAEPTSHVASGAHTVMAAQRVIEASRQLLQAGAIAAYDHRAYVDGAFQLFWDFALQSGAVDWTGGALHSRVRVAASQRESGVPALESTEEAWQHAELLQALVRLHEEERLLDLVGPGGETGLDLLTRALAHYRTRHALSDSYEFDGVGNPDAYHRIQLATYLRGIAPP